MNIHVSFLHDELIRLPSFPRKALDAEFLLYSIQQMGKVSSLCLISAAVVFGGGGGDDYDQDDDDDLNDDENNHYTDDDDDDDVNDETDDDNDDDDDDKNDTTKKQSFVLDETKTLMIHVILHIFNIRHVCCKNVSKIQTRWS